MKFSIITVAVLVVVMLSSAVDAWGYGGRGFGGWGYGGGFGYGGGLGYGGGWGGMGMGYGYPSYLGYSSYGYGKRATLEAPTRLECLYSTKTGGINCNKGFIECEASLDITGLEKFDMFGVGIVGEQIRLYPKNFTTSLYGDFKMLSNDLSSPELSIFLNGTNGSKGIMVKDSVCYNKIVGLVKSISSPVISSISSDVKISVSGFILDV